MAVLIACSTSWYNFAHEKYRLTTLSEEQQDWFADQVPTRLNLRNPYSDGLVTLDVSLTDFPTVNRPGLWTAIKLLDFDMTRHSLDVQIPIIQEDEQTMFMELPAGSFGLKQAFKYLSHLQEDQLSDRHEEFSDEEEYFEEAAKMPEDSYIFVYHQSNEPDDWDSGFHPFPPGGLLVVGILLPSQYRSSTNRQNYRETFLIISPTELDHLGFRGPLRQISGWSCYSRSKSSDVCARMVSASGHVTALALRLFCPWWHKAVQRKILLHDPKLPPDSALQPKSPFCQVFDNDIGNLPRRPRDTWTSQPPSQASSMEDVSNLGTGEADNSTNDNGRHRDASMDSVSSEETPGSGPPQEPMDVDGTTPVRPSRGRQRHRPAPARQEPQREFHQYQRRKTLPDEPDLVVFSNMNGKICSWNASMAIIMAIMRQTGVRLDPLDRDPIPEDGLDVALSTWSFGYNLVVDPMPLLRRHAALNMPEGEQAINVYGEAQWLLDSLEPITSNLFTRDGVPFLYNLLLPKLAQRTACTNLACFRQTPSLVGEHRGIVTVPMLQRGQSLSMAIEDHFANTDRVDTTCQACGRHGQETVEVLLDMPKVLVVKVQRLEHGPTRRQPRYNRGPIEIGEYDLELPVLGNRRASLTLAGVMEHRSSIKSGHFVAHLKEGQDFLEINDSLPVIVSNHHIPLGLLYFYIEK